MLPEALASRPTLPAPLTFYLDCFYVLSRGRSVGGMGTACPIALSEYLSFFQIYGIEDPEERRFWLEIIIRLDNTFLEHAAKKVNKQ